MARKQRRYSVQEKREGALLATQVGVDEAARQLQRPRGTIFAGGSRRASCSPIRATLGRQHLRGRGARKYFLASQPL
jgi:hypothetical protein